MTPTAVETVTTLLRAADDRDWGLMVALMDEQAVSRNSAGRIYVGHGGVEDWRRDLDATTSKRFFELASVRELADGFVMVVGVEHRDPMRGSPEAVPGAWIYMVRNGRVNACMYFRTERDAIASLTGPGRGGSLADILEGCADAFNR